MKDPILEALIRLREAVKAGEPMEIEAAMEQTKEALGESKPPEHWVAPRPQRKGKL